MKKTLFALPLLLAVPLMAQMPKEAPGKLDPSHVTAGTYAVEPTHTLIGWTINHFGFNDYFGVFGSPTGTLKLDPAKPNASSVSIDIPVGELFTANAKLTEHLKSAD
ncbi:MAG: YceI family protein, partial [Sphingomonadaceae bacterium]